MMIDYATKRRNMVESQLRPNGVTDFRINTAMLNIPRERFVAASRQSFAYIDEDIPFSDRDDGARCVVEPMVFARLVQLADIADNDIVLDIGCGLGYSTAVLAQLAQSVVALENDPQFVSEATSRLGELGVSNAAVVEGPLNLGYAREAPYDVIVVNGGVGEVPEGLLAQLKEGGRLVAVIDHGPVGRATLFVKQNNVVSRRAAFDAAITRLPDFDKKSPAFVF